jgi:hypothetical protein
MEATDKQPEVIGRQIRAVEGLTDLRDVMLCQNSLHESCRMGRHIVLMKLICFLGHCECNGHTVHKLSHRRLTANILAPTEKRMHSKMPCERFSRYPKWLNTFRTALIFVSVAHFCNLFVYVVYLCLYVICVYRTRLSFICTRSLCLYYLSLAYLCL